MGHKTTKVSLTPLVLGPHPPWSRPMTPPPMTARSWSTAARRSRPSWSTARRCCVCRKPSSCSWRTWWAASTPSTPSARGWRSHPWSAMSSRRVFHNFDIDVYPFYGGHKLLLMLKVPTIASTLQIEIIKIHLKTGLQTPSSTWILYAWPSQNSE